MRYDFGVTEDGQSYAVKPGRHVVRMLRGGKNSLRAELSQAFYQAHKKAQDQDPDQVHLRVATADGVVWLDLGDAAETAVRVDQDGWQIVEAGVPVLFRRTRFNGALPEPQSVDQTDPTDPNSYLSLESFDLLWRHLNVAAADRPLVLAWMVAAMIDPESPHPILSMFGEQGTGKSTASRRIVSVVAADGRRLVAADLLHPADVELGERVLRCERVEVALVAPGQVERRSDSVWTRD